MKGVLVEFRKLLDKSNEISINNLVVGRLRYKSNFSDKEYKTTIRHIFMKIQYNDICAYKKNNDWNNLFNEF